MEKIYDLWLAFITKRMLGEYEFPVTSISIISCCGLIFIYTVIGVIPVTKHINSDHIVLIIVTIFYSISLLHFFGRTAEILSHNKHMIDKKKIEDNNPYNNTQDVQRFPDCRVNGPTNLHIQLSTSHVSSKKSFDSQQGFPSIVVGTMRDGAKIPGNENYNNRHQNKQHPFADLLNLPERFLLIATASFWVPLALLDRKQTKMGERNIDYDYLRDKADMLMLIDAVKAIPILMLH